MPTCNNSPSSFEVQLFYNQGCSDPSADGCGGSYWNTKCTVYYGPNLPCSGVNTSDTLDVVLSKFDEKLCAVVGDYSSYNFHCLPTFVGGDITTQAEFVSAITNYACTLKTDFDTFVTGTFVDYQDEVSADIASIRQPLITCVSAGVTSADSLSQVLIKYCSKFASLSSAISLSGVTWNGCYTVATPPTTIAAAFQLLSTQICTTKGLIASSTLPIFDNSTSCIDGTSSDSLITTIGLIKTKLCTTPTYDIGNIDWGCVDQPYDDGSIDGTIQSIVSEVGILMQNFATYSGDFIVTQTNPENPCAGVTISLATPLNIDRFVAATSSDESPGTLLEKLFAGANITIDEIANPGQITISSTGGDGDHLVKASGADDEPDTLEDKIEGTSTTGFSIGTSYNGATKKLELIPTVSASALAELILAAIDGDEDLKSTLCALIAGCPSPCDAPTNVQAVAVGP